MKKSDLLKALQTGIRFRHLRGSPAIDSQDRNGVVVPGCPACRKRLFTMQNFMDHLVRMTFYRVL